MTTSVIAILVLAILIVLATLLKIKSSGGTQDYPYRQADAFLSKAELSFFGVLRQAVADNGMIFAKVRMADVLAVKHGLSNARRQTAFNKIKSRHFDFVICTNDTIKPMVAIELDDSSHNRKSQIARDAFVNRAAKAASLPLLRIPAKHAYSIAQLREKLAPHFKPGVDPEMEAPEQDSAASIKPPTCSRCGSEMVSRHGKSGALAGKKFWGCAQYPKCKNTLPMDA